MRKWERRCVDKNGITCYNQAEGGIRGLVRSSVLEDVYKRQAQNKNIS